MNKLRMTVAQRKFLRELATSPIGVTCIDSHKPPRRLVELGLACVEQSKWGHPRYFITEAGTRYLVEMIGGDK